LRGDLQANIPFGLTPMERRKRVCQMRFKSKLFLFAAISLIFVMALSIGVVTFIITRQNKVASQERLCKSLEVVRDDLLARQENLVGDAQQLASIDGMGSKLNFLFEFKKKPDEVMTATTYNDMTKDTNQIRITGKLWSTSVYDSEGDLITFSIKKDGDSALCGFASGAPNPTISHALVKKGEEIRADLWHKTNASPDPNLALKHTAKIPRRETVTFEAIGNSLCLVAYAPAKGYVINQQSNAVEMQVVGFTRAVMKIDDYFSLKLSTLTGMGINVFLGEKLSVGTVSDYAALQSPKAGETGGYRDLAKQEILLNEIEVGNQDYFQGILAIPGISKPIGAVAALYSKKFARANTRQMVVLLALVSLGCLVLILPFCVLFAYTLTRPIDRAINSLTGAAREIYNASGLFSTTSQKLADGASAQAASVEESSSSLEEMASMTRQGADHARQADLSSNEAMENLQVANRSMKSLIESMAEASSAGSNVSKIIETIDKIAFQTNLLALNAAVEAARAAGQAGAGFAVVADEVRLLALRSAEASKSTQKMVTDIIAIIDRGLGLVKETDDKYRDAAVSVQNVSEWVGQISVASEQLARGIDQINQAVVGINRVTQQNAAGEESAAASQRLDQQAKGMHRIVAQLVSLVGHRSAADPSPDSDFSVEPERESPPAL
jgi:uncharacterized membrane protein